MPQINTEQYNQLKKILTQMFQLDQAELDFGIYRIMNQKRTEINDFLDNQLLAQIQETLQEAGDPTLEELKQKLTNLESTLQSAGVNPDENNKVQELRAEYAKGGSIEATELEVYSRLTQFFKRYYKEGDFISQRRYKEGVYAIPYEGEEVKLHWANHDQYYIKTGEYFKNYSFKADGKKVNFVLKEADTERDNNKAQSGKERRFKLFQDPEQEEPTFEEVNDLELNIYFTYEPTDKKEKQKKLNEKTFATLSQNLPGKWTQVLLTLKPTEKNKKRTLLEYRLTDYTAKNSFDYFIHKDLGKFLRQELDFYIKNEILHLDDIDLNEEQDFKKQLTLIKALKKVALKIIDFLAQLEDFQKKLWLKKKMVLQSDYCITLDQIDESFYKDITQNEKQLKEWEELFDYTFPRSLSGAEAITELKDNPYLLIDTQFYSIEWKYKLLATIPDIDQQCDGLLINSENFQALNLLQKRYNKSVNNIYFDPPYNTDSAPILYKNNYKSSTWISLISERAKFSKELLTDRGVATIAIDDAEMTHLSLILDNVFNDYRQTKITVVHNPKGSITKDFNRVHEYAIFLTPEKFNDVIARTLQKNEKPRKLRRWGEYSLRTERPLSFYPIYIKDGKIVEIGENPLDSYHPKDKNLLQKNGSIAVYPIDQDGVERRWNFGLDSIKDNLERITILKDSKGKYDLFVTHEATVPKTVWKGGSYDAGSYGNTLLIKMLGDKIFDFPKSIYTVEKCVYLVTKDITDAVVLDYFAGSGTTAHAVINLNRGDNGNRKYILVEMGEYFNTVTKPRVQKVIYSDEWKNGKPTTRKGSSHCFKYMRLESYEDTLNNLVLHQQGSMAEAMQEEYLLRYALEVESRESLLMLDAFKKPFGYTIKSTENNELIETEVDLVETFNYFIGLQVETTEIIRGYVVVTGQTLDEKKVLVVWRDTDKHSNADLNEFFKKLKFNPLDGEFDQIYVNGDNNIENLKTGEERWKVRLIEHEFHKRMWEVNS